MYSGFTEFYGDLVSMDSMGTLVPQISNYVEIHKLYNTLYFQYIEITPT